MHSAGGGEEGGGGGSGTGEAIRKVFADLLRSVTYCFETSYRRDGRKNAVIIDDDADLDEAIDGVVESAFGYQGQKCGRSVVVY
jgi:RHH-type proline utilization regulon transcriptional repressor/proline dehydrogenase/delta 1-pyrroline-5-carboxylate dehydrogenase